LPESAEHSPISGRESKESTVTDVITDVKSFETRQQMATPAGHLEEGRQLENKLKALLQQVLRYSG
jgi:excinuclease ABC subunit A